MTKEQLRNQSKAWDWRHDLQENDEEQEEDVGEQQEVQRMEKEKRPVVCNYPWPYRYLESKARHEIKEV